VARGREAATGRESRWRGGGRERWARELAARRRAPVRAASEPDARGVAGDPTPRAGNRRARRGWPRGRARSPRALRSEFVTIDRGRQRPQPARDPRPRGLLGDAKARGHRGVAELVDDAQADRLALLGPE